MQGLWKFFNLFQNVQKTNYMTCIRLWHTSQAILTQYKTHNMKYLDLCHTIKKK